MVKPNGTVSGSRPCPGTEGPAAPVRHPDTWSSGKGTSRCSGGLAKSRSNWRAGSCRPGAPAGYHAGGRACRQDKRRLHRIGVPDEYAPMGPARLCRHYGLDARGSRGSRALTAAPGQRAHRRRCSGNEPACLVRDFPFGPLAGVGEVAVRAAHHPSGRSSWSSIVMLTATSAPSHDLSVGPGPRRHNGRRHLFCPFGAGA